MLNNAIINLNTLRENALNIKKTLNTGVKFCAVVKADGYGHGGVECAQELYSIVDCFAVALIEEAVTLRMSGINKDILVFNICNEEDIVKGIENELTLTAVNLEILKLISQIAYKKRMQTKVHIKINTGMNRQGCDLIELDKMFMFCKNNKYLVIEGIYSHFACPECDMQRKKALDKFLLAISIAKGYNKNIISHISASGGLIKGVQLDMVRIGILIYGYKPFESDFITVKPVMQVNAPIMNKRLIHEGELVMYGCKGLCKNEHTCIIRYGYADGLPRVKTEKELNNRCMDLTSVKDEKNEGYYTIMDNADELAKRYNTISYEVLTKVSLRAEKIYIR